ncbi:hypothetical protein [Actinokineospora sp. PR83]|uniref:hypothetical protein n=1 Tax=Actinokineospora sp. PR83 TaxID=2884908 RepID=UPI0035AB7CE8
MFGGDNAKSENFVPLYLTANQVTMRRIADMVARRLDAGERIYYYMRPEYNPQTASGIPLSVSIFVAGDSGGQWYSVSNK